MQRSKTEKFKAFFKRTPSSATRDRRDHRDRVEETVAGPEYGHQQRQPSPRQSLASNLTHQTQWPTLSSAGDFNIVRKKVPLADQSWSDGRANSDRVHSRSGQHTPVPAPLNIHKTSPPHEYDSTPFQSSPVESYHRPSPDALKGTNTSNSRESPPSVYSQWHESDGDIREPWSFPTLNISPKRTWHERNSTEAVPVEKCSTLYRRLEEEVKHEIGKSSQNVIAGSALTQDAPGYSAHTGPTFFAARRQPTVETVLDSEHDLPEASTPATQYAYARVVDPDYTTSIISPGTDGPTSPLHIESHAHPISPQFAAERPSISHGVNGDSDRPATPQFRFVSCSDLWTDTPLIREQGLQWYFAQAQRVLQQQRDHIRRELDYWTDRKLRMRSSHEQNLKIIHQNVRSYENAEHVFDRDIRHLRQKSLEAGEETIDEVKFEHIVSKRERKREKFEDAEVTTNEFTFSHFIQGSVNQYKQNATIARMFRVDVCLLILADVAKQLHDTAGANAEVIKDTINLVWAESTLWPVDNRLGEIITTKSADDKPYTILNVTQAATQAQDNSSINKHAKSLLTYLLPLNINAPSQKLSTFYRLWHSYIPTAQHTLDHLIRLSEQPKQPEQVPLQPPQEWRPPQLPSHHEISRSPWRSPYEANNSLTLLNTHVPDRVMTMYLMIWRFFNSPDIAPFFISRPTKKWSLSRFKHLIEDLITDAGDWEYWLAFLKYCDHTGEMFLIGPIKEYIYISPRGWDLRCEGHVSHGFERRAVVKTPRGVDVVEKVLKKQVEYFCVKHKERRFERVLVLNKINRCLMKMGLRALERSMFDRYVRYWSALGRFFICVDSNDNTLTRIDNGFSIPATVVLPSLASLTLPNSNSPPLFTKLFNRLKATDISPACMYYPVTSNPTQHAVNSRQIYTNDNELYNILFSTRACEISFDCSRYSFHLFLRWCGVQEDVLVRPYRGGDVLVLGRERAWGGERMESRIMREEFGSRHGGCLKSGEGMERV